MAEAAAVPAAGAVTGGSGGSERGSGQPAPPSTGSGQPAGVDKAAAGSAPPKPAAKPIPPEEIERRKREKIRRDNLLGFDTRDGGVDDAFPDLLAEATGKAERDPKTGRFLSREERQEKAAGVRDSRLGGREHGAGTGAPPLPGSGEAKPEEKSGEKPEGAKTTEEKPAAGTPPPQTPEQKAAADAATVARIKFLGKEMTVAEAEQQHKSLQGMFSNLTKERDHGWNAGWAWKAEYDKVVAELERVRNGSGAGTGASGAAAASGSGTADAAASASKLPTVDELLASVDGNAFEAIAATKGVPAAAQYLAANILSVVSEKIIPAVLAKQAEEIAPFKTREEQAAVVHRAGSVIERVGALKFNDGADAFPEAKDGDILQEVGRIWTAYGMPEDQIYTDAGLMSAISLYRSLRGPAAGSAAVPAAGAAAGGLGNGSGAAAAGAVTPPPTPAPGPAASVPDGGRGNGAGVRMARNPRMSPEQQRLIEALERTDLHSRTPKGVDLGFQRNPRPRDL